MSTIQTHAALVHFGRAVELTLYREQRDGNYLAAKPLEFVATPPPYEHEKDLPTARLTIDEAQALAEALWRIGIRPRESQQNATELAALKAHLEDMRTISFGLLKGEL